MTYSMNLFRTSDHIAMWRFLVEMAVNRLNKTGSDVFGAAQHGNRIQFVMTRSELVDYLIYYYAFKLANPKSVSPELQFSVCTKEMRATNVIVECAELEPLLGCCVFKILDNSWTKYPVANMGFDPLMKTTHVTPDERGVRKDTPIRMHAQFLKEFMAFKFKTPFPHIFRELENVVPALKQLFPNHQPDTLVWLNNELKMTWRMLYVPFDVHYVTRFRLDSGAMYTYDERMKRVDISIPYTMMWRMALEYDMVASPMAMVTNDETTRRMYQAVIDKGITPQMLFN